MNLKELYKSKKYLNLRKDYVDNKRSSVNDIQS